jgi:EcsC protein family
MSAREKILHAVNEAVILAVKGVSKLPGVKPDPKEVLDDLRESGAKLESIEDISRGKVPLDILDNLADRYFTRHTVVAAGSGLASLFGALGIAGTVGGLLGATVGLAHRLALVYGFDDALKPGNEDLILIGLGSAAGIDLVATPFFTGVGAGAAGAVIWLGPAASAATAEAVAQAVSEGLIEEALAPALAEEIVGEGFASTVGEMIPFVGAAVGAIANTTFLRIWGKRMLAFYRGQHLVTLDKVRSATKKRKRPTRGLKRAPDVAA